MPSAEWWQAWFFGFLAGLTVMYIADRYVVWPVADYLKRRRCNGRQPER